MRFTKSHWIHLSAAALTLFGTSNATVSAYKTVTVQDNGQRKVLRGFTFGSLASFLNAHKLSVQPNDHVYPDPSTPVTDDMNVSIESPIDVTIVDAGHSHQVETFAHSVHDLLDKRRIMLNADDYVDQPMNEKLRTGDIVAIHRTRKRVIAKTHLVPYQTIHESTDALYIGESRIIQRGIQGQIRSRTTVVYVDDHRVYRNVEQTLLKDPVNELVQIGTKPRPVHRPALSARSMDLADFTQITVIATAYVAGGRTATGCPAAPGVIAVDPNVIPLGTKLYIPGMGEVHAEDTGGAIVGNRIDICMNTEAEALNWGRRTMTIYVLKDSSDV